MNAFGYFFQGGVVLGCTIGRRAARACPPDTASQLPRLHLHVLTTTKVQQSPPSPSLLAFIPGRCWSHKLASVSLSRLAESEALHSCRWPPGKLPGAADADQPGQRLSAAAAHPVPRTALILSYRGLHHRRATLLCRSHGRIEGGLPHALALGLTACSSTFRCDTPTASSVSTVSMANLGRCDCAPGRAGDPQCMAVPEPSLGPAAHRAAMQIAYSFTGSSPIGSWCSTSSATPTRSTTQTSSSSSSTAYLAATRATTSSSSIRAPRKRYAVHSYTCARAMMCPCGPRPCTPHARPRRTAPLPGRGAGYPRSGHII